MMKALIVWAVLFGTASTALAQAFDFRLFRPTTHANGTVTVEGGEVPQDLDVRAGLVFDYARRPLQALDAAGNVVGGFVVDRFDSHFIAALGALGRVSFSIDLPLTLYQSGDLSSGGGGRLHTTVLGDVSLSPKIGVLDRQRFWLDLAVLGFLTLPSGDRRAFAGNPEVTGGAELDASREFGPVWVALNVGGYVRRKSTLLDFSVGPELFSRIGVAVDLARTAAGVPIAPFFEIYGRTSAVTPFQNESQNQLEANLGSRFTIAKAVDLQVGVARGLSSAVGSPTVRVFFSAIISPMRLAPEESPASSPSSTPSFGPVVSARFVDDNDGDGVPNADDKCPDRVGPPEKKGCPFLDTDNDGIEDGFDKCPAEAGPTKNYGCPLKDSDGDGFDDPVDRCPALAEDKDGFEDDDGCPDDDNDRDGIPDYNDKCPNQSEIINGVDDYDGCPDNGRALVLLTPTGIELRDKILFKTGTADLDWRATAVLRQVVALLVNHTKLQVLIEVHMNDAFSATDAQAISEKRADAVRAYLVAAGIDIRRLRAAGFGFERPLMPHTSSKAKVENERVVFSIRE